MMSQKTGKPDNKLVQMENGGFFWALPATVLLMAGGGVSTKDDNNHKEQAVTKSSFSQGDALDYNIVIDYMIKNMCRNADYDSCLNFINNKYVSLEHGSYIRIHINDIVINNISEFDNNVFYSSNCFQLNSLSVEITRLMVSENCDYHAGATGEYYDKNMVGRYIDALNGNIPYNVIHELGHGLDYLNPLIINLNIRQFLEFKLYSEFARRMHVLLIRKHILENTGMIKTAFPVAGTYVDKFLNKKESEIINTPYFWQSDEKSKNIVNKIKYQGQEPYLSYLITDGDAEEEVVAAVLSEFGMNYEQYLTSMITSLHDDFFRLGGSGYGVTENEFDHIISQMFSFYIDRKIVTFPVVQNGKLKHYISLIMGQKKLREIVENPEPKIIMNNKRNER